MKTEFIPFLIDYANSHIVILGLKLHFGVEGTNSNDNWTNSFKLKKLLKGNTKVVYISSKNFVVEFNQTIFSPHSNKIEIKETTQMKVTMSLDEPSTK